MDEIASITGKMAYLCSRREYCSGDIAGKLRRSGLSPQEISEVLSRLRKEGYIDDMRFAAAFVRDKSAITGWGGRKIEYALRNKGIDNETIAAAMRESISPAAERRMKALLFSKWKSIDAPDIRTRRARLLRYAAGRGYGMEDSVRIMEEFEDSET